MWWLQKAWYHSLKSRHDAASTRGKGINLKVIGDDHKVKRSQAAKGAHERGSESMSAELHRGDEHADGRERGAVVFQNVGWIGTRRDTLDVIGDRGRNEGIGISISITRPVKKGMGGKSIRIWKLFWYEINFDSLLSQMYTCRFVKQIPT